MKRLIIAGTHSGCGKTTVTCAVLAALKARGLRVSAFKCGPDYIDPMFHREVIGVPSHNLDSFFCGDDTLRYLFCENSRDSGIAVIEGVMGFYDGAEGRGSAHSVSCITETPAVIVIDCRGMSDSIGAVMRGFLEYKRPNRIAGFILNRLPERLVPLAKRLCGELGTRYLGSMPKSGISLESRSLGLVTAEEIPDIKAKLAALGELAEKYILPYLLPEIKDSGLPAYTAPAVTKITGRPPVIAAARDRAFCFIYADNIELLERMGCTVRYFSPIADSRVPEDADGLILCGGYPELHAAELSGNTEMLADIKRLIGRGMPVIAECGGSTCLHETFEDMNVNAYKGAGVIPGKAYRTDKLARFGYVTLTAGNDGLLCGAGESFPAHEFHYFDSTCCGRDMTAEKPDGRKWDCVHHTGTMYAGFPHLYFYADTGMAERFVNACRGYMGRKDDNS